MNINWTKIRQKAIFGTAFVGSGAAIIAFIASPTIQGFIGAVVLFLGLLALVAIVIGLFLVLLYAIASGVSGYDPLRWFTDPADEAKSYGGVPTVQEVTA